MNVLDRMIAAQGFANDWTGKPFVFGETDCVCAAIDMRERIGLPSPIKARGRYRTAAGALRFLRRAGYSGLVPALDDSLQAIAPARVLPGDILGFPADAPWDVSLSVVLNGVRALAIHPHTRTWEHASIEFATHAWRIG